MDFQYLLRCIHYALNADKNKCVAIVLRPYLIMVFFVKQKETVEAEIDRLKHVLDVIEYKCWYYDEAIKDGNEERLKTMKIEDMPDKIREIYLKMHNMSKDN